MKLSIITLLCAITVAAAQPPLPHQQQEWLCSAIYYAEGGSKSTRPYGIRDGNRPKCRARIQSEWQAWLDVGHPGRDFVAWLAQTWAPIQLHDAEDAGHINQYWADNVRRLYDNRANGK